MNRSERRSWDRYVAEAREQRSEIDLPDGSTITVYAPTSDRITELNAADDDPKKQADIWYQLGIVLGEQDANRLREHAGDAPVTALTALLKDVLADLGLTQVGNSPTSSS